MKNQRLMEKIAVLSDPQAAAVDKFVDYLQTHSQAIPEDNFRTALDSFIREHSDLLRRLAE